MMMKQVESSQVAAIGYDPSTQTYAVQFKTKGGTPAPHVYHYAGVDAEIAQQVDAADSTGSAVRRLIVNGGFEFTKIEVDSVGPEGSTDGA